MKEYFEKLKSNLELNPSFDDIVKTRHTAIRGVIENKNPEIKKTQLIGSLQRKTRIQPRPDDIFDIDVLVVMGSFHSWLPVGDPTGITPDKAIQSLHSTVTSSDRYATKNPQKDAPTVTLTFDNSPKVELVPAYIDMIGHSVDGKQHSPVGRGYWVPKKGKWELADYDYEADYMSQQNTLSKGWLVPIVKMLKAIKRIHFQDLGSFPLEIIAAQVIPIAVSIRENTNQEISYSTLIGDFFIMGKDHLNTALQIPGSNSSVITHDPFIASLLFNKFNEIQNYVLSIPRLGTINDKIMAWRVVFGDMFPTTLQ